MSTILEQIKEEISTYPVVLYMKGTRDLPRCGFSATVIEILNKHLDEFEVRNVLESEELRQGIKEFSNWPTIPQLYVNGTFVGGCDIVVELDEDGDLASMLQA